MLIQLLIEREGDTHIARLENVRYKFKRNEHGDMVCDVNNKEHILWMLMSASYREYAPREIVPVDPDADMVNPGKKPGKRKVA